MTSIFKNIFLYENQKASEKELSYTISLINKTYNEWRKIRRRINAVDIVTTTANRIAKMNPASIEFLNDEMKLKLALIVMRCMDNPHWKPVSDKAKLYEKMYEIISRLQDYPLNTGTGGSLREVIMTRLSAALAMQDDDNKGSVMVCYEPHMPDNYGRYMSGEHKADKIYKMQGMGLPAEFEDLVAILKVDLKKAIKRYKEKT